MENIYTYLLYLKTPLYFVLGLGLLIFIHELGHFLVAKWSGIRVERFSLGFGPRLIHFRKGETEYCLSLLPLGGYVKMSGQDDFETSEILPLDDPRSFNAKSILTRMGVVFAGPVMNLLLPFILMPLVFILGRTEPKFLTERPQLYGVEAKSTAASADLRKGDLIVDINGSPVQTWEETLREVPKQGGASFTMSIQRGPETLEKSLTLAQNLAPGALLGFEPMLFTDMDPFIAVVRPGSPAEQAGLKPQDKVLAVSGKPVSDWNQMSQEVENSQGKALEFKVERDGKVLQAKVSPTLNPDLKKYIIGVEKASNPDYYTYRRYPFLAAVKKGAQDNIMLMGMTFDFLGQLFSQKASYKDLGGPVRIAQILGKAAQKGLGHFLYLVAFLSIQLGILNLLPIPVLDGGHIVFLLYEGIAKKPLSMKKRILVQQVGMALLLALIVFVTFNDILALGGFDYVATKFRLWF